MEEETENKYISVAMELTAVRGTFEEQHAFVHLASKLSRLYCMQTEARRRSCPVYVFNDMLHSKSYLPLRHT